MADDQSGCFDVQVLLGLMTIYLYSVGNTVLGCPLWPENGPVIYQPSQSLSVTCIYGA